MRLSGVPILMEKIWLNGKFFVILQFRVCCSLCADPLSTAKKLDIMKHAECIIFPDIHGRDFWKSVLLGNCEWESDLLIFLGDYFDPYPSENITPEAALDNWDELMDTLRYSRKTAVFIMGNHDAHYLNLEYWRRACSSRYNSRHEEDIYNRLRQVPLHVAHELTVGEKRVLFTHAGLVFPWYVAHKNLIGAISASNLNRLTESEDGWKALAEVSEYRGGISDYRSPLWADRHEFNEKSLDNIGYDLQIVGHNQLHNDKPARYCNVVDLDCHHPFALTEKLRLRKIDV